MRIAIHHRENSFSTNWIKYCKSNELDYSLVNCRNNDIIKQLRGFDGLIWHWGPEEAHYAVPLTISLEKIGVKVFPDFSTCWHFDNKIAQYYLLETCNITKVPTYIFYSKESAINWANTTTWPKVFKLKNGASSTNVKLIQSKRKAIKLINQAFSSGFYPNDRLSILNNQTWKFKRDHTFRAFLGIINGVRIILFGSPSEKFLSKEKGYVYFQDYIPNNTYDTRIVVVGDKAFAVRRYNRKNDFRASGSGAKEYDHTFFEQKLIQTSFLLSKEIQSQTLACDYIKNEKGDYLLVEISYGFVIGSFYENCHGYWTPDLKWHDNYVLPETFIIESFLKTLINNKSNQ